MTATESAAPPTTSPADASPAPTERWLRLLGGAVLVVVTIAVYRSVVEFELLTWDDDQHIVDNELYNPLSWSNVLYFWQYAYIFMYIPVSYNFWAFEVWLCQFFPSADPAHKFNPAVFHVGNLMLHVGSVILAYRLLLRMVPVWWAALVGAAIFSFHPLQCEPVCWVGETRGLLCTFFSFLAWWYHLRSVGIDPERGILAERMPEPPPFRKWNYFWGFFFFGLALLSKPAAASLPLVIFVVDVVLLRRSWISSAKHLALWFVAAAVITGLTKHYQTSSIIYAPSVVPWWERPLVAGDAYAFYLEKLVWPFDLAFEYARAPYRAREMPGFAWRWLIPIGVAVALAVGRRRRLWLGAYLIFVTGILSVSGIVPFLFQAISTVGDRYMYVPMLGFGLMAATWLASLRRPLVPLAISLFLLGLCAQRTYEQSQTWRSDWTLCAHGLRLTPDSYIAHHTLGNRYRMAKHYEQAIPHFTRSFELRPDFVHPLHLRGVCLQELGRIDEALADFELATVVAPGNFASWIAVGDVQSRRKNWPAAETAYQGAIKADPKHPHGHIALGALKLKRGDPPEAVEKEFKAAVDLNPESADTLGSIGRTWLEAGHYREATAALEQAVKFDPNNARAQTDLAGCYHQLSKFALAIDAGREAVRLDPQSYEARHNFGLALAVVGRPEEAAEQLQKALELVPPGTEQAEEDRRALEQLRGR